MSGHILSLGAMLWLAVSLAFGDYFAGVRGYLSGEKVVTAKSAAYSQNEWLLKRLDAIVKESDSVSEARKNIALIPWPDELLVMNIVQGGGKVEQLYCREIWTGVSSFSRKGVGFGALVMSDGKHEYAVLEGNTVTKSGAGFSYELYVDLRAK